MLNLFKSKLKNTCKEQMKTFGGSGKEKLTPIRGKSNNWKAKPEEQSEIRILRRKIDCRLKKENNKLKNNKGKPMKTGKLKKRRKRKSF